MYIKDFLDQYKDKKIKLFVDMDGVIADYIIGQPKDYDKKRPLFDSINKLKLISELPNVEMYVHSKPTVLGKKQGSRRWIKKNGDFLA